MKPKTEIIWYLCVDVKSDGRVRSKKYRERSMESALKYAADYEMLRRDRYVDIWVERHEVTTAIERIEVVADGHEG